MDEIRQIQMFRPLSDRYLRLLANLMARRELRKGERVYREGQPCDRFVIIRRGRFNLLKTGTEGRQKVVSELWPGQHFGLAEIITGRRSNVSIEAGEPAEVLMLSKEDLVQTLLENPRMCFELIQMMAGTILDLSNQIQEVSFERVAVRLARLLLVLAEREGVRTAAGTLIRYRYSHQELAKRLGTSRETVTRTLKRFRALGVTSTQGRMIVVKDRERLRRLIGRGGVVLESV